MKNEINKTIPYFNEKAKFKLRESKKIIINQNLLYIKSVLYKNFINLENKYNHGVDNISKFLSCRTRK